LTYINLPRHPDHASSTAWEDLAFDHCGLAHGFVGGESDGADIAAGN
jgi:hypothetical protein